MSVVIVAQDGLQVLPARGELLAGVFLFAILWSVAPAIISAVIASNRGQSVLPAVLLGLFLGWIGLLLVYFLLRPEVTSTARNVVDRYSSPGPALREPRARLQQLEQLKRDGLVTDEEYAARRAAIVQEL